MHNRDIGQLSRQLMLPFAEERRILGSSCQNGSFLSYDEMTSLESVFAAWYKFRRGKRSRLDIMHYERHLEENLFTLREDLIAGCYRHGAYTPFQICDPKQRQIHKASVRDRVVHQLVISSIEPLFERQFMYDSFSCRKKKGTHAAFLRLQSFLQRTSHNNTRTVYALKCDIRRFFASVDHGILFELLKQRVDDPATLGLLKMIIASLSNAPGKGIPLGNLTSQLFANVYLHEFDWYMKQTLRTAHYLRYCDDFIIVSPDREYLLDLIEPIRYFLRWRLQLDLHPAKVTVHSWHQGIDFLGYVTKPHCTLLRPKTQRRMLARVTPDNLTSYTGLCSHADAYRTVQLLRTLAANADES
jgi:retron-type reverse transcriptase